MFEKVIGRNVIIIMNNKFRYTGNCIGEDQLCLHLDDTKVHRLFFLSKKDICTIEIIK